MVKSNRLLKRKAFTKDCILQPYVSNQDFRSSNEGDDTGYKLYVFPLRYQEDFIANQPIKKESYFDGVVPTEIDGYALVLRDKMVSINTE